MFYMEGSKVRGGGVEKSWWSFMLKGGEEGQMESLINISCYIKVYSRRNLETAVLDFSILVGILVFVWRVNKQ